MNVTVDSTVLLIAVEGANRKVLVVVAFLTTVTWIKHMPHATYDFIDAALSKEDEAALTRDQKRQVFLDAEYLFNNYSQHTKEAWHHGTEL